MDSVLGVGKAIEKEHAFQELLDDVLKRRMHPEDRYEIAAYLESVGWNDDRVSEVFGAEDIFELAEHIWNASQEKVLITPFTPLEKTGLMKYVFLGIRNFLRGLIFALPMAISVFAMLTLRFSLWSYEYLSTELATSIAIGTILSFMTVGGFTQAIARRGFFYITQGYYNMGRRMTFIFVKQGYVVCFALSILFVITNMFFHVFPYRMLFWTVLFYFFLSAIWLSVTVMYILERELVFTGLLVMGILVVFVLYRLLNVYIIFAQIIALAFVAGAGILLVLYFFRAAEVKMEKGISPSLPRMSITLYSVLPYFIYGFLYFTFLYIDRVVAWSTNDTAYMPYLIWFRGPYELGLDFALLMLMIPMGVNEVVVSKLMKDMEVNQKNFLEEESSKFSGRFLSIYIKRLVLVTIVSLASAFLVYKAVTFLDSSSLASMRVNLLSNATTHFVFIWALIAYAVVAVALMNAIILFSLSQPEIVIQSIFPACAVNLVVGFLLSRWFGYGFAILGLLAGGLLFAYLTSRSVIKVLKNLDYYLYAAA